MAVSVTEGGLMVSTSADAWKRRANHQSGYCPTYMLASSLEVGPEATVSTLKQGTPYYCIKTQYPRGYLWSRGNGAVRGARP
jgi:hypothetical protein